MAEPISQSELGHPCRRSPAEMSQVPADDLPLRCLKSLCDAAATFHSTEGQLGANPGMELPTLPCGSAATHRPERFVPIDHFSFRVDQKVVPMPTTKAPARIMKRMDCLTHETAGTARAKTSPRKHNSSEARLSPARKEPSASNIRRTRLVAGAGSNCCTPDSNMMFMATRTAIQCTAWVQTSLTRACLSSVFPHSVKIHTIPDIRASNSQ